MISLTSQWSKVLQNMMKCLRQTGARNESSPQPPQTLFYSPKRAENPLHPHWHALFMNKLKG